MGARYARREVPKPVVLAVLDGFGVSLRERGNAIRAASKPNLDAIERRFPFTTLQASGVAVGLPWGEAGNSEVGHLTMGAGRVIYHHLPRIIVSIQDGSFFENPAFQNITRHVREHDSSLHLIGLVSSGSVHSYAEHLFALLELATREGLRRVFLHAVTDGKDAPPEEGVRFIAGVEERLGARYPAATLASLIGRFFAMDRDGNWDRIRASYDLLAAGRGAPFRDAAAYLGASYRRGITDEKIEPAYRAADDGLPIGRIAPGDGVILFNFREDSMREITEAFAREPFDGFARQRIPDLAIATMTEYERYLPGVEAAFPPLEIAWPLARVIASAGIAQLHIAETEKYAHVTYFFNGGTEKPFPDEDRILVPSTGLERFDERPEMRALDIAVKVIERIGEYGFILANFSNADMVGHTGNFEATVRAVAALDGAVGKLRDAVLAAGGALLITADHGNAEEKLHPISGEPVTEHTANPVPFLLVGEDFELARERSDEEIRTLTKEIGGIVTDIAPTVLELLGLPKPEEMAGKSLLPLLAKQLG